jgi:hypothetical protein
LKAIIDNFQDIAPAMICYDARVIAAAGQVDAS